MPNHGTPEQTGSDASKYKEEEEGQVSIAQKPSGSYIHSVRVQSGPRSNDTTPPSLQMTQVPVNKVQLTTAQVVVDVPDVLQHINDSGVNMHTP
jgi:hypothetical protein